MMFVMLMIKMILGVYMPTIYSMKATPLIILVYLS